MSCGKAGRANSVSDQLSSIAGEEQPSYQHEAKASPHNWQRGKYMTLRGRDMVARYASLLRRSHYHAKMKLKDF